MGLKYQFFSKQTQIHKKKQNSDIIFHKTLMNIKGRRFHSLRGNNLARRIRIRYYQSRRCVIDFSKRKQFVSTKLVDDTPLEYPKEEEITLLEEEEFLPPPIETPPEIHNEIRPKRLPEPESAPKSQPKPAPPSDPQVPNVKECEAIIDVSKEFCY